MSAVLEREGTIFSFVVDVDPAYTYEGWHLARSLVEQCGAAPSDVHVQCTPELDEWRRELFRDQGYSVHHLERFGDGRNCNKLNQLASLLGTDFQRVVLLDTDTIAISDLRPFLRDDVVLGKPVDLGRPPIPILDEIARHAGLAALAPVCLTDASDEPTYLGNFNGGFYSIPRAFAEIVSDAWRQWALWLLENIEPLASIGRRNNVDQVSFWLAASCNSIPLAVAPSNVNYFTHMAHPHRYLDTSKDISLLHYHDQFNVLGEIEPTADLPDEARQAVARANEQIGRNFDNRVFWDLRYSRFPDRGAGLGSRGENLVYKRELLLREGLETASSVLDIGCGDLEVLRDCRMADYLGVDVCPTAIARARHVRPDLDFRLLSEIDFELPPHADLVLCLEVLIHQSTRDDYLSLIRLLARATKNTLIVSGREFGALGMVGNHMIYYHEPLSKSLADTGRFRIIERIGGHTSVEVFKCTV